MFCPHEQETATLLFLEVALAEFSFHFYKKAAA
jgi:hypothetical protein